MSFGALIAALLSAGGGTTPAVTSDILGVTVGSPLKRVHEILDPLGYFGGRATEEGGKKLAWTLREGAYKSVAVKTDKDGDVVWITGFCRPGSQIPFESLGAVSAGRVSDREAIWSFKRGERQIRLVAKGSNRMAGVVYLIELAREDD